MFKCFRCSERNRQFLVTCNGGETRGFGNEAEAPEHLTQDQSVNKGFVFYRFLSTMLKCQRSFHVLNQNEPSLSPGDDSEGGVQALVFTDSDHYHSTRSQNDGGGGKNKNQSGLRPPSQPPDVPERSMKRTTSTDHWSSA